MEAKEARLNQLDIEADVEFAQYALLNAARIWSEFSPEQKQRLQKLIFPSGVLFAEGAYRSIATSMIFFELEEISDEKERLVAQSIPSRNHILAWLQQVESWRESGIIPHRGQSAPPARPLARTEMAPNED
jgi:hypothetical protein